MGGLLNPRAPLASRPGSGLEKSVITTVGADATTEDNEFCALSFGGE